MSKERAGVPDLDGTNLRVAIVASRWNAGLVEALRDGARRALAELSVTEVDEFDVPGAFELPLAARRVARAGRHDAIVAIGAVVRGETSHYELITEECASGIQRVQLETDVPIGFGLLTVENRDQAHARTEGPGGHNVGEDAAAAAVELALFRPGG